MTEALDARALKYACQCVEDFALVNKARSIEEKGKALDIWLAGLGLTKALELQLAEWIEHFIGIDGDGAIFMIGFAVGLFVNQYRT